MYSGICMISLCLWHFHAVPLTNAAGEIFAESLDFRMWNEFQRIYVRHEAGQSSTGASTSNANDDVVVAAGSSNTRQVGYFNPVDQFWQYEKCRQLKWKLVKYLPCNQTAKILHYPSLTVEVRADEYCFYRALSCWVSGTSDYHHMFQLHVLEIVKFDQRIKTFLGEENYAAHLIWTSQNVCTTETEIVAASILLNTPIYVYSYYEETWYLFDQNGKSKSPLTKEDKCIYLQYKSRNTYNLVTDVNSDQSPGSISLNPERATIRYQEEKIRYFNPIDEAWQQEMCKKWEFIIEQLSQYDVPTTVLKSPKKCVEIQKDKKSFFRAISYCLTGAERHHKIIRNRVAEEIIFNRAIQGLYPGNKFISFIHNDWATKEEIIASAVLLNTSIFIYSHDTQTWDLYNKNIEDHSVPLNTLTEKCIYLRQKSPNEYDVVQEVETFL
ncbi:uncharacterized protein LOC126840605 [Adelges cooleyi]|uniref:uncharacterized protein LOC126840605 n=1 Tax=Adelges cooleyi TaxID=133065 RepID=UPI002180223D|nr:uncharacterized protein LOC126840605 [Adelges cooleyi]